MTGKKHVEGKIFGKKPRMLNRTKLDLKKGKGKERLKLLGGVMAELRAVQTELMGEMEERLLELRSDPNPPNPHDVLLTGLRLGKVNKLATLVNDVVDDLADEIIAGG